LNDKRMSSENRKMCILSAVRGLFSKKGMQATSKEISEVAGVSEALIYKHFGSKEGLYQALVEESCRSIDDIGNELAEQEASTTVLVCATYLLIHIKISGLNHDENSMALTPEESHGLITHSLLTDGKVAEQFFDTGLGPWVPYFVDGLKAAKKSGDLSITDRDLESLVWMAHHSILGINMTRMPEPPINKMNLRNEDQLKDKTLHFMLRGMGLKEEAIQRCIQTNEFKNFKNKLNQSKRSHP
jgi:AcrR family transcriptional regulator